MGTDKTVITLYSQQRKQEQISHLINSTVTAMLNSCFDTAVNNIERQATIEVSQDFGHIDLAQVLIEKYNVINN